MSTGFRLGDNVGGDTDTPASSFAPVLPLDVAGRIALTPAILPAGRPPSPAIRNV